MRDFFLITKEVMFERLIFLHVGSFEGFLLVRIFYDLFAVILFIESLGFFQARYIVLLGVCFLRATYILLPRDICHMRNKDSHMLMWALQDM